MLGNCRDMKLIDCRALFLVLFAPVRRNSSEQGGLICKPGFRRVRKQQILGELSLLSRDRSEPLEFLRIHYGQIQPGLRAVIEENRVHYLPRACRQSERNV